MNQLRVEISKDLKGNNNDKIRGVVFQRFELVDQTQVMDKETR